MFNYIHAAQFLYKEIGNDLRNNLGDYYEIRSLIVNGELEDISLMTEKSNFLKNAEGRVPYFNSSSYHLGQLYNQSIASHEAITDLICNFFYSLMEEWDRRVFKLVFSTVARKGFIITIYDANDDPILVTSQKLYWASIN